MRRIKRMIFKHFNCIPWFIVGIQILVDGEISRWQYAMCWICTLVMIWMYAPNRAQTKGGGKVADIDDRKKWFDMILSGEKTEEYRELKRYYDSRFRNAAMLKNQEYQASVSEFRNLAATVDQDIGTVRFRNGYTTDAPCFLADCKLTVGEGKPEWGAVPGTEYYILKMKNVRRKE